jgi:hypothetical protein
MLQAAANAVRGAGPPAVRPAGGSSLLLTENQQWIGGPPALMDKLSQRERELVLKQGRRKVLNRGQTLFSQGGKHDGIWLIESGRIRVFYTSPLGREITLYFNRQDVLIIFANAENGNTRLGYKGPPNAAKKKIFPPEVFEFVDCTHCDDYISDFLTEPMRTHQYYRQSPTVRTDIVMNLAGLTPQRPKYDQLTNSYILFPPRDPAIA